PTDRLLVDELELAVEEVGNGDFVQPAAGAVEGGGADGDGAAGAADGRLGQVGPVAALVVQPEVEQEALAGPRAARAAGELLAGEDEQNGDEECQRCADDVRRGAKHSHGGGLPFGSAGGNGGGGSAVELAVKIR